MKNSKLIKLLEALHKTEFDLFFDYVKSPFFNKRVQQIHLLEYLRPYYPDFPENQLDKASVYKTLFVGKDYDDKKMRYEMSYLTKLLEGFLAQQSYREHSFTNNFHLLEGLNRKKLDKYFWLEHNRVFTQQASIKTKTAEGYYRLYLLSDLADQHFLEKRERKFDVNIQNASNYLDLFYLSKKLRYCCNMADRQKILAKPYQINFLDELDFMLQKIDFKDLEDIEVYDKLYKAIDSEIEEKDFNHLLPLLKSHADFIHREDLKEIYIYLINYCARKIRSGVEKYVETALEIYLEGIHSKVLFEDGFLSPWTFKNIISLGLRLERFDWVATFIMDYNNSIKPEFRQDALYFNQADLCFHKRDFKNTLAHLNELKYTDIYYNLNGRVLLLKTYFHLEEISPLLSGIASFTIYLKRNKKLTKEVKKSYLNFCNLLNQIIKAKPAKLSTIQENIDNTDHVISKAWLNSICSSSIFYY